MLSQSGSGNRDEDAVTDRLRACSGMDLTFLIPAADSFASMQSGMLKSIFGFSSRVPIPSRDIHLHGPVTSQRLYLFTPTCLH